MLKSLLPILWLAMAGLSFGANPGEAVPAAEIARARAALPGVPRAGDVLVRSYPKDGRELQTLKVLGEFHVTRLEWTYGLTAEFVKQANALGVKVGGALEDDTPEAGGTRLQGRVTGPDGLPKKHVWFAPNRWVGCANAPEYFAATLAEAKKIVDAGAEVIQQDDPQMAVRCDPPFCYCRYCVEKFAAYQQEHGAQASYAQFQMDSIVAFHRELHRQVDTYAHRHIPFSHNDLIGFQGKLDSTAPAFDYVNCEFEGPQAEPQAIDRKVLAAGDMRLVFQYRDTSVAKNRRTMAACYAAGAIMMQPWDVYLDNQHRYYGAAAEYADLSGFVRANASYLNDYERVAVTGVSPPEAGASAPLLLQSEDEEEMAFVRARPGQTDAPVVIHLVAGPKGGKTCVLKLRKGCFFAASKLSIRLLLPVAYDAALHHQAEISHNYSQLSRVIPLEVANDGEFATVTIPPLDPWAIAIVTPQRD